MMNILVITGMIIGSFAGGYLPALWGRNVFSISSIFLSALGAFAGIWAGYKIAIRLDL